MGIGRRWRLVDGFIYLSEKNEGQKNYLTGPSGNAINAFLAAYDPMNNVSVISLKDRRSIIEFLKLPAPLDWNTDSYGQRFVASNKALLDGIRALGLNGSALRWELHSTGPLTVWWGLARRPCGITRIFFPKAAGRADFLRHGPLYYLHSLPKMKAMGSRLMSCIEWLF